MSLEHYGVISYDINKQEEAPSDHTTESFILSPLPHLFFLLPVGIIAFASRQSIILLTEN